MGIEKQLSQGQILDNNQLCNIFGCSPQGGMRRSLKTNTLVIISNHVESIYDDRWINDVFHYTGMGQKGDQSLNTSQNKTLAESNVNGVEVHLFEVEKAKEYIYQGQVILSAEPYREIQPDLDGIDREVVVFPLRLLSAKPVPFTLEEFNNSQKIRERKAKKLSAEELKKKAMRSHSRVGERKVQSTQYERDPYVSQYTKHRANGVCDLCLEPAPFKDKSSEPYLETHHVEWLSRGGKDVIENTVALCPNCHRKMHVLDNSEDKQFLLIKLIEKYR